jgi:hypothetical protein
VQTASFVVPAGSPIARMAHQVNADSTLTRTAAAVLRSNVVHCPCTDRAGCPALNEMSLLLAMEQATGSEPVTSEPGWRPCDHASYLNPGADGSAGVPPS